MKVVGVVSDAELLRYMVVGGRASTRFARSSSSFIRSLDLKRGAGFTDERRRWVAMAVAVGAHVGERFIHGQTSVG